MGREGGQSKRRPPTRKEKGIGKSPEHLKASAGKERSLRTTLRSPRSSAGPKIRLLIVLGILALGLTLVFPTAVKNIQSSRRLREKEWELARQKEVTRALERKLEEANSLDYVEREARKQRLVAPGETLYVVAPEGRENQPEVQVKAIESMEEAWRRIARALNCRCDDSGN